MSAKRGVPRQTQHRPERDTAHAHAENEVRKENQKLKRQNARLRQELTSALTSRGGFKDVPPQRGPDLMFKDLDVSKATPVVQGAVLTKETIEDAYRLVEKNYGQPTPPIPMPPVFYGEGVCPKCGTLTRDVDCGPKTVRVCPKCKWRRTV